MNISYPPGDPTDETIERARRMDPYTLEQLHERYYPDVYRYVSYRLGEGSGCLEICNDVFFSLLNALHNRRDDLSDLDSWFTNTVFTLVNERQRQEREQPGKPKNKNKIDQEKSLNWLDNRSDMTILFIKAIGKLPPDQQHVLALRMSQNRSLDKTAILLNVPLSQARELQYKALVSLKLGLEKEAGL